MKTSFIHHSPVAIIVIDEDKIVCDFNELAAELFSFESKQGIGESYNKLLAEIEKDLRLIIDRSVKSGANEYEVLYLETANMWLDVMAVSVEGDTCLYFTDITRSKEYERELELYKAIVDNISDSVVITNSLGNICLANEATEKLLGYSKNELNGRNVNIVMSGSDKVNHDRYIARYLKSGESGILGIGPRELVAKHKNGEGIEIELAISEFNNDESNYFVGIMRDIRARKELQTELERLAWHDRLTGLPDRGLLCDRVEHAISFASRQKKTLALLFIDLDGFKAVNDSYGHKAGDHVIVTMAERMTSHVRECDTVARIGGDEFVVLLDDIKYENITIVANKILKHLNKLVKFEGNNINLSGSIGVSRYPENGDKFDILLNAADQAMYRAKKSGKNKIVFSEES